MTPSYKLIQRVILIIINETHCKIIIISIAIDLLNNRERKVSALFANSAFNIYRAIYV